jgi:hypothetical protein
LEDQDDDEDHDDDKCNTVQVSKKEKVATGKKKRDEVLKAEAFLRF